MNRLLHVFVVIATVHFFTNCQRACGDDAPPPPSSPVLTISGGGILSGAPKLAAEKGRVSWHSPVFATPFEFPLDAVSSIRFAKRPPIAAREGDRIWELVGGDLIVGKLLSFTDKEVVIGAVGLGEIRLKRGLVVGVHKSKSGSGAVFEGPGELSSWAIPPKSDAWTEGEDGSLSSKSKFARIWRTLDMPELAKIELELAWKQKGAFSFEITKDVTKFNLNNVLRNRTELEATRAPSYRLELAGGQLIAGREAANSADVAPLQEIGAGEGQIHLVLYVDQTQGTMSVCRPTGELIAKVSAVSTPKVVLNLIRFSSGEGDLRIITLRVAPWSGVQPVASKSDTAVFSLSPAADLSAQIESFDAEKREWLLKVGDQSRTVKEAEVSEIRFSPTESAPETKSKFVFRNGMLLNGECIGISPDSISFTSPNFSGDFTSPNEDLSAIYQRTAPQAADEPMQRLGRLEATGVSIKGWLVDHAPSEGSAVIGWKPKFGLNDAAIAGDFSGKIVYRELPPLPPAIPPQAANPRVAAVRVRSSTGAASIGQLKTPSSSAKPTIYLRTGDMVQGEVLKIDERGIELKSDESKATFIAHKDLRAIELATNVAPIGIPKAKKDRLLMLPRAQRESPPTHLVRSLKGDYLRCRIVDMDENTLNVEVRLESKRIPRSTIARIIWLHPEEAKPADKDAAKSTEQTASAEPPQSKLLFQAIPESRKRLTFSPQRVAANMLVGQSPILGECNIDLETTSVLLIGAAIENSGIPLAYDQWKLRPAPEPIAASESPGDEGGGADGLESVLVGKPAPDIDLTMLDGKKFSLASRKNKVVILDFWASWCGPCIQAMPQIHEVAKEFAADGVELVGINLEEAPEKVTATLKRLELELAVALDRDGRVAGKYGATSIPQTVIIDAEGKVARVFVGGGPRFGEQLRQAVRAVLGKPPIESTPSTQ